MVPTPDDPAARLPVETPAETPAETVAARRRRRRKDLWQLDLPLVVVLAICVSATVIEVNRAGAGNWRAAVYSIEWPLIGAFAVWMWFRFRKEGGSFRGIANRWRERVARFEAEAAAQDPPPPAPLVDDPEMPPDAELDAWNRYRAEVRDRDQAEDRG